MLKNPIPKVTNQLQHRAIGIINAKFTPLSSNQLNRGFLIDNKDEKIETVVLGKALSLLKKHIDLKKSYYWIVYPKNKNTQNLHLQVAGIWDPYQLNDFPVEPFEKLGYSVEVYGQKSYNGVAIISKIKPQNVKKGFYGCKEFPSLLISKLTKLCKSSRESSPFMTNLKFLFFKFFEFVAGQILITISFF